MLSKRKRRSEVEKIPTRYEGDAVPSPPPKRRAVIPANNNSASAAAKKPTKPNSKSQPPKKAKSNAKEAKSKPKAAKSAAKSAAKAKPTTATASASAANHLKKKKEQKAKAKAEKERDPSKAYNSLLSMMSADKLSNVYESYLQKLASKSTATTTTAATATAAAARKSDEESDSADEDTVQQQQRDEEVEDGDDEDVEANNDESEAEDDEEDDDGEDDEDENLPVMVVSEEDFERLTADDDEEDLFTRMMNQHPDDAEEDEDDADDESDDEEEEGEEEGIIAARMRKAKERQADDESEDSDDSEGDDDDERQEQSQQQTTGRGSGIQSTDRSEDELRLIKKKDRRFVVQYEQFLKTQLAPKDTWFNFFNAKRDENQLAAERKSLEADAYRKFRRCDSGKEYTSALGDVVLCNDPPACDPIRFLTPQQSQTKAASASSLAAGILKSQPQESNYVFPRDLGDPTESLKKSPLKNSLFYLMNDYRDIYYTSRTHINEVDVREAYVLHALNHVTKSVKYQHYNDIMQQLREAKLQSASPSDEDTDADASTSATATNGAKTLSDNTLDPLANSDSSVVAQATNDRVGTKDQGFFRARVLILVPFRHSAYKIMHTIYKLMPYLKKVHKKEEFELTFTELEEPPASFMREKPKWFKETFAGNIDDNFAMGLTFDFARDEMEIFTQLRDSDIIIATPLGIQAEMKKKINRAFSSIEVCIMDQCDVMLMQNFDHAINSLELLNGVPRKISLDVDFNRVRSYFLHGAGRYYRQNIILSGYMHPELNFVFNSLCNNIRGKVKIKPHYDGVITRPTQRSVNQVFERIDGCSDVSAIDDFRFEYFTKEVYPRFKDSVSGVFMIFANSYLDFVRLRNFFKAEMADFEAISEHDPKVDKILQRFDARDRKYLIYTERHHFFHWAPMRLFRRVNEFVFYNLPDLDELYLEAMKQAARVQKSGKHATGRILSLYSQFDALKLERIVGSDRCALLMESSSNTHLITTSTNDNAE